MSRQASLPQITPTGATSGSRGTIAVSSIFPVARRDRAFTLQVSSVATASGHAFDSALTALDVPFGYDGDTTLVP